MHLLIVTDAFPPDAGADAARLGAHSHYWTEAGAKVSVVVSPPDVPCAGESAAGPRRRTRASRRGKVRMARLQRSARSPRSWWARWENGFGPTLRLLLAGLRVGAVDVVLCATSDVRVRWAALLLSRMRRRPLVLEVLHDPLHGEPDTQPPAAPVGGAARELWFCKAADMAIAASRSLRDALVELGVQPTKVEVVADGLDWDRCSALRQVGRAAPGRKADEPFVVGWSDVGAGTRADKLAAAVVDKVDGAGGQSPFRMVALAPGAGDGPAAGVESESSDCGGGCAAADPVGGAEQPALQPETVAALDACVVVAGDEALPRVPPLVYDCVGAAVPVVVGFQGETADLVTREGVGMVCHSGDTDVLAQQLLRLQQDTLLRARLSAACREAAPRLDRASRAKHMLEVLRRVAAAHKMHRKWRYNRRLSGYRR
ncbi:glycosyltransferase [Thiohalocapsa halophila]|nr:glycosyltransferase [Thiohalocapsa halophila]